MEQKSIFSVANFWIFIRYNKITLLSKRKYYKIINGEFFLKYFKNLERIDFKMFYV